MSAVMQKKGRLAYPDLAKGVGMILVIIAHSPYPSTGVMAFITAFHMPLFFIVSGMLMCHTNEEAGSYKKTVLRRAKGIMIPYLAFSLLYMLLEIATMIVKPENVPEHSLYKMFVQFITLYGISVLWFLTALFFGQILFLGIKKLVNLTPQPDVLMILAGVSGALLLIFGSKAFNAYYPLYSSMALLYLGDFITALLRGVGVMSFLTIGYYLYRWYFNREAQKAWHKFAELAAGAACFLAVYAISVINGVVDFHFLVFSGPVLYFAGAVLGSAGTLLLCRHLPASRLLYFFGANSLIIMVTHLDCRVLITAINYANWLNQYITRAKVYMLYLNVAVMVILLEVLWVHVLKRLFPFMLGKPFSSSNRKIRS